MTQAGPLTLAPAIPLAIPSYIGAMSYITLLGPVGSVNTWLSALLGTPQQWVNIYGFWGGVFVLGLFTYPYIFLLVSAALEATNPAVEETARSLGDSPLGVFRRVTLPMLRPSMLADRLTRPLPRSRPRARGLHQKQFIDSGARRHARGDPRTPHRVHRPAYAAPHRRAAVRHHPDWLRDPGHRARLEPDPPVQHLHPVALRHGRGSRRGLSDPFSDPVGPRRGRGAHRHQPAPGRGRSLARRLPVARAAPRPRPPGPPHAVRGLGARVHLRHEGA